MTQPINEELIREYCLHHELARPEIHLKKVVGMSAFAIAMVSIISFALYLLADFSFLLCFDLIFVAMMLCCAKPILWFAVQCYQHYASDRMRRQCSCMPSCSEYALLALDKYLWPKAIWKIWRRVTHTCSKPGYHIDYP